MKKGLLWYAHDLFLKRPNGGGDSGGVPHAGLGYNDRVLNQGNYDSQLKANKGMVYACTDIRGIGVAKMPLRVYITQTGREKSTPRLVRTKAVSSKRKDYIKSKANPGSTVHNAGDLLEVTSGPFVDLLRTVNDYQTADDLKALTINSLDLTGDCYWVLIRNKIGTPVAIWIIPSGYMSPIPDKTAFIKGYKYKRGTKEIIYPKDDVIHFKKSNLLSQYVGKAPLDAAAESVNLRTWMMEFEQAMFKSGGNYKALITTDKVLTEQQGQRVKATVKKIPQGDIGVVTGADWKVTVPPHITSRDMGYREGLALTRDEIAAVLHVPKSILTTDDVNLANAQTGERLLGKWAIEPLTMMYQEKVTEQLAWQFDQRFVAVFDDPVPENREALLSEWKMFIDMGVLNPNEVRAFDGLEPREGGDEYATPGQTTVAEVEERLYESVRDKIGAYNYGRRLAG